MVRLSAFLALLLLLLTFNAYACVLPLPTPSHMDCTSTTEGPDRQTCDSFPELGPHSEHPSSPDVSALHIDFEFLPPFPAMVFSVPRLTIDVPGTHTQTHLSIQTTVLRI